jgi:hypothetical protein
VQIVDARCKQSVNFAGKIVAEIDRLSKLRQIQPVRPEGGRMQEIHQTFTPAEPVECPNAGIFTVLK